MKRSLILLPLFLIACASFVPYQTEWKTEKKGDVFHAVINGKASEKAISVGSIGMKISTCTQAVQILSTSQTITKQLVDNEKESLGVSELNHLSRLISNYKIQPELLICQSTSPKSFFGSSEWETCQCLYAVPYPGGRKQLKEDIANSK